MKLKTLILFLSVPLIAIASSNGYGQTNQQQLYGGDSAISVYPNTVDYLISQDIQLKECSIENKLLNEKVEQYKIASNANDSINKIELHSAILNTAALSICEGKNAINEIIISHQEKVIARKSKFEIALSAIAAALALNYFISR